MIALDTNVLIRFLTQDDPVQGAQSNELIAALTPERPGYICREVAIEMVWVLERGYGLPRETIAAAVEGLLETRDLAFEQPDRIAVALQRYRKGGAGFSDQMIALSGQAAGCSEFVTFDRKAAAIPGARLLGAAEGH